LRDIFTPPGHHGHGTGDTGNSFGYLARIRILFGNQDENEIIDIHFHPTPSS
jgi:hypothetical protein